MKIKEYQEIINKTAVFPKEIGLAYCALGLVDELGEYIEKEITGSSVKSKEKEAGDVFWYITALAKELGSSLEKILHHKPLDHLVSKQDLFITGSKIQGKIKKFYRDGDKTKQKEAENLLIIFTQKFLHYIELNGLVLTYVLEKNYNKLIARRATNTLHGDGDNREE